MPKKWLSVCVRLCRINSFALLDDRQDVPSEMVAEDCLFRSNSIFERPSFACFCRYVEASFEEKWNEVARMVANNEFDEIQKYEELGEGDHAG